MREELIKWIRANPVAVGKQTDHFQSNLETVLSWLTTVRLILYEIIYRGRGGEPITASNLPDAKLRLVSSS
jgi:hypothetical protein